MIGFITPDWFWNNSGNYNFISGPLPDITLMAGVAVWWRKHDCHVKWCPRIQWHPHPVHGHPVCRRHHPESQFKSDGSQHPPNPRHQAVMHKSDVEHGAGLVAEPASAGGAKNPSPHI
jgi:hypothetical protein